MTDEILETMPDAMRQCIMRIGTELLAEEHLSTEQVRNRAEAACYHGAHLYHQMVVFQCGRKRGADPERESTVERSGTG